MSDDDPFLRLAIPVPDADGAHAIDTPVADVVDGGPMPDRRGALIVDGVGAVVTADQCRRVAEHLHTLADALDEYHGGESA